MSHFQFATPCTSRILFRCSRTIPTSVLAAGSDTRISSISCAQGGCTSHPCPSLPSVLPSVPPDRRHHVTAHPILQYSVLRVTPHPWSCPIGPIPSLSASVCYMFALQTTLCFFVFDVRHVTANGCGMKQWNLNATDKLHVICGM